MSKYVFVSDFDNTISCKDFYHIIIDKYLGEQGKKFYNEWKKSNKINVDFLNQIFASVSLTEAELRKEVLNIPLDMDAFKLIKAVKESGNDFYIVSAGTSYYIDILFENMNITGVNVISMKGIYENGKLVIKKDVDSKYYSEVFGIDKGKVIEDLKGNYDKIFFAGDSEPDLNAAKAADVRFAKGELADILEKDGVEFKLFESFRDINKIVENFSDKKEI